MEIKIVIKKSTEQFIRPAQLLRELAEIILTSSEAELNRSVNDWAGDVTDINIRVEE